MQTDFLTKIVKHKKEEIAAAKRNLPESLVRDKAVLAQKRRMFLKKLEEPGPSGINIIAEIKRASPSKGEICRDVNPAIYASEYERGGAAALSVLTDTSYFKGSINDLKAARQAVTIPVLRKDFLISTYQIYESAMIGADAVLLIARILSPDQLKDYLNLCNELNMDALVEIHSEKDMEVATMAGARLIGINNRDLSTFKTDINTTINMASLLKPDQVAVAASGIRTREDIEKIQKAGIWNFLIGESLMRASNPRDFLMSLMGKC
ncbi:MAG: indole-3-glycerol phosphate synthase TrpC [Desulfobacteraceae bacterium]|nr:indole-3-glycerol phosphate synthase TrpC [Pseudomonadota bacterium]MBU4462663.1 indole-3-glycerol phosphate synthase TrpC [Pseudomonadota bacterium]MCG2755404.1 indole-3-glycerol phosphate synthase TrpC [Desulfobacteraceae bacterium]